MQYVRFQGLLTPKQKKWIEKHTRHPVSGTEIMRRALDAYIKNNGN